ncbi:hypothetical protein DPEC_G00044540 [Dallia pectoralis]|uniref:Uncharacterized protein n=1 Tax=Dallia pectoralis TaxID=75939 RepID=A0ACC2H9D1_DALPE|nr:hypothetical protein DPEC_G00044540 [Dallia pectoralis]
MGSQTPCPRCFPERRRLERGRRPSCRSRVVGALQWGIERTVQAALREDPGPGNGPPGRLFVPEGTRSAILEWGHSSRLTCHPGVARTMSFLRRRFWWPSMGGHSGVCCSVSDVLTEQGFKPA